MAKATKESLFQKKAEKVERLHPSPSDFERAGRRRIRDVTTEAGDQVLRRQLVEYCCERIQEYQERWGHS